jgi:hypothetical protein
MKLLLIAALATSCIPSPPHQVTECHGKLTDSGDDFSLQVDVDLDDLSATARLTISRAGSDLHAETVVGYHQADAGWLFAPIEATWPPGCADTAFFSLDREADQLQVIRRGPAGPQPWPWSGTCAKGTWEQ